jgi:hypothetical protein
VGGIVSAEVTERSELHGRWLLDPDDTRGFEQLGLHGFDFDRHGDVVMSALTPAGLARALFCWRLDNHELVLEEISSKQLRRHAFTLDSPDVLFIDGTRYFRRDADQPLDSESGLFCIGSAGLRHALASISFAPPEGVEAFAPLLLLDVDDALESSRLQSAEDPLRAAKTRAHASKAKRCAFVHDGASGGERAVVAMVSERGLPMGRTLMLRYRFEAGQVVAIPPVDSSPSGNFW